MKDRPKSYHLDAAQWNIEYCVLDDALKQQVFNNSFLYFMTNITGGRIVFTAGRKAEPTSVVALDLESSVFESGIIALGQVVACEPVEDDGLGYNVEVECWWMGWKNLAIQKDIADFIVGAFTASPQA